ncbi:trypsin-like serine peptidase [Prosthecomicrobium sp. N25]|uniref:trypsin-like serine peptidase n=1 Tax=Prosthecomicrobium sp. N25 TaxID=3129254 RepID=UPI0030784D46
MAGLLPAAAAAQTSAVNIARNKPADLPTTELRAIPPMPLPLASSKGTAVRAAARTPIVQTDTVVPATEPVPADPGTFLPLDAAAPAQGGSGAATGQNGRSKGTAGYPFTTTRVFPDQAVTTAPYRMSGKVYFRNPRTNAWYMCTGSLIAPRLVLTAGHCVYEAVGKYYYTDFRFIPAYNATATTQPYGQWGWAAVHTTSSWMNGGGTVPNAADFGIIEIADMSIAGSVRKVGDYLGYYGFATGRLLTNHVTAIGYPGNIDSGGRMIANAGEVRTFNAVSGVAGSSMGGGSSGGPWLEDFGVLGSGQLLANSASNRVVGVTSFGPSGGPYPYFFQGSSILNSEFLSMRTTACNRQAGNC